MRFGSETSSARIRLNALVRKSDHTRNAKFLQLVLGLKSKTKFFGSRMTSLNFFHDKHLINITQ